MLGSLSMLVTAAALGVLGGTTAFAQGAPTGELVDRSRLRVCSDPDNLPFSNEAGEGFENKIAELLAQDLGVEVEYTWYPGGAIGFIRNTLGAIRCDLVMGIATTSELLQNTNPYYRSSYVLIQRADAEPKVESLRDVRLNDLRVGAVARTPPVTVLAREGLLDHLVPYQLMVDTRFDHPAQRILADVASGRIDVGALWGPIAGYWATRQNAPIAILPLSTEAERERLDFRITMGLRRGEPEWKDRLNRFIAEHQSEIQTILLEFGVPLLDGRGQLISPKVQGGETPGQRTDGRPPEPDGYRMGDYRAPVPSTLAGATIVDTVALQQLVATGQVILIDVLPAPRAPKDRAPHRLWRPKPHANIPGSIWLANVGYGELSTEFETYFRDHLARFAAGGMSRPLVFYCQADCWMSWNAAKRALSYGYRNVVWYPAGTDGWRAAGLPLEPAEPEPMPDFLPLPRPAAMDVSG